MSRPSSPAPRKHLDKIKDEIDFFEWQAEDVRHLAKIGSWLNAIPMGLGKTLESLTVAAIDFQLGRASRVLIVCPATLKGNWADEIAAFTHFTYTVLDGTPAKREKQLDEFDDEVLIVNYEQVVKHLPALNALHFDIVIYDEAHYMKSYKSHRTRACHGLQAKRHFLLTGSPILGHASDLWALLHRIDPVAYPRYWAFVHRYCVFGGYKDKQIVGTKNDKELRERLHSVMLRRDKSVLNLPNKLHVPIRIDLTPRQTRLTEQVWDEMKFGNDDVGTVMEKYLRVRQICGTSAIVEGEPDESSVLDVMEERVKELVDSGEKVVVFTQFRAVLACAALRLTALGVSTWQLHGDVAIKDRKPTVDAWAAASEPGAIVCMLQVAGVGLNMTAARHAVFLDKLYVPKLNEQAEDRLHRIGASQSQPVTIIDLQAKSKVADRLEKILRTKVQTFDTLVEKSPWKRKLLEALKEKL